LNIHLQAQPTERRAPSASPDGYIRLSLASLSSLSFLHLFSATDQDFLEELLVQTIPARAAGFTEWKSETHPCVSIAWGWFIHSRSERLLLAPEGIRSNVMLIDAHGYDLGSTKTSSLFSSWLNAFEWQDVVSTALR
jgi:hypothetical protein